VQRGHVGQPSPEPVRRTAPPVTTSTQFATRVAQADGRNQRSNPPMDEAVAVTPT
jgi:hypothetical protein